MMIWLLIAFLATLVFSLILIKQAANWGFVDLPEDRKIHLLPTPRTGGVAVALGSFVAMAAYLGSGHPMPVLPWQTCVAGLGFLALGGLDDRFGFHPRQKVLYFALFALLAAWPWAFGGPQGTAYATKVGPYLLEAPRWLAYPILAIWFLAVPNAVNIEDAVNGYMAGYTIIILGVAMLLGVPAQIPVGALLGFLILNWPKAKHFLGDAGSFGCGFLIAEALLRAGGNHNPLFALIITAPISMDVCMGIIRRIRLGMSLFDADRSTFPHHMVILCRQSVTIATPFLWANAIIIAILAMNSAPTALGYLACFALALFWVNRGQLLHS